jgi:hypothetical protein
MKLELVLNEYGIPSKWIIYDYSAEDLRKAKKVIKDIRRMWFRDMLHEIGELLKEVTEV